MFNGLMSPSDSELATQTLGEEGSYRFSSFSASDAVTLVCPIPLLSDLVDKRFPRASPFGNDFVLLIAILKGRD